MYNILINLLSRRSYLCALGPAVIWSRLLGLQAEAEDKTVYVFQHTDYHFCN